ncbi:YlcI/YnfO family protein [Natronoglycomyces albus]|uniref:Toxin-antitoxin system HicB family antitoxin n=1 Tax=Natronoglycomyces albus TaxID=2811108 RepID=A0A895XP23_9ACTN|nr:YlcI/YnfO family protein [Natronoglycomyces albus]QSB05293.1 toxin-antitoxin system HicB family antitoxin [Natronoglycomyces albus]
MDMRLRIPDELKAQAVAQAEIEHRSLNSFVVNAIEEYVLRHGQDNEIRRIAREEAQRYRAALDELGK